MYFIFLKELRFVEILFCQCFRNYKHIWYLVEDTCIKEVNSPHNISPYSFPPVPFFFYGVFPHLSSSAESQFPQFLLPN